MLDTSVLCLTRACPLTTTVVLPPEKPEGCESYLQYLHTEDGERETLRDATKSNGKKRISLNVSIDTTQQCFSAAVVWVFMYCIKCNLIEMHAFSQCLHVFLSVFIHYT